MNLFSPFCPIETAVLRNLHIHNKYHVSINLVPRPRCGNSLLQYVLFYHLQVAQLYIMTVMRMHFHARLDASSIIHVTVKVTVARYKSTCSVYLAIGVQPLSFALIGVTNFSSSFSFSAQCCSSPDLFLCACVLK